MHPIKHNHKTVAPRPRRNFSPLTLKILGVNVIAIFILAFGFLYSAQYESELIDAELAALKKEAQLISAAISEGGTRDRLDETAILAYDLSQLMVRKISAQSDFRILAFNTSGRLIADSHKLLGAGGTVEIQYLAPPKFTLPWHARLTKSVRQFLLTHLPSKLNLQYFPKVDESEIQSFPHMIETLKGESYTNAWYTTNKEILLTASYPVAQLKQTLGGIMLIRDGERIESAISNVQFNVVRIFLAALAITIFLSVYLSTTIGTPIRELSKAADKIRTGHGTEETIPNFSNRRDEIGDLSLAIKDMTNTLNMRLTAIERFAADVAHELKNPLASLRSAIETLENIEDTATRHKLYSIINDDIRRLDRLITEISAASRLDAELSRLEHTDIDLYQLLSSIIETYQERPDIEHVIHIEHINSTSHPTLLHGNEGRLGQVFFNLLDNALSFAAKDTEIRLQLWHQDDSISVSIENDGDPIPESKLETIFERFYTQRPKNEAFGTHSGLGLHIAQQIVHAHHGHILAENITDSSGQHTSVRFTVTFPVYSG